MADASAALSPWERSLMSAEKVKERLRKATTALDNAGVPYAVIGGNAVAEWVARVDEDAVRNTRDVDLLIRRVDFVAARKALEEAGFVYTRMQGIDVFLDGPQGRPSGGVHILYAGERARPEHEYVSPDLDESERTPDFPGHNPCRPGSGQAAFLARQRPHSLARPHRRGPRRRVLADTLTRPDWPPVAAIAR